ncbi:glyoxalase/bleomycin resistance/extradiol dioxygenase family protein [Veronia nyctiphanis]|uniref:Glyoxalase/bleomycin resistance/extradiol dioxygenase family protein n=1 Tax=Veronia nyctiphanis TaxID=1278244 RepID=A0A4Q0YPH0_9GAMM|nr:VOC family protein [Veronia nyctiphanis]RXJ72846.1 glyoxalase/bleomycin resistance/extradiol dioxygenase family protein [Veronia nyctiphanis]
MIDHFEIKTNNFDVCKRFYQACLALLNIELKWSDDAAAGFGVIDENKVRFLIEHGESNTGCHIAFSATDENAVKQFHHAAMEVNAKCNGKPGLRAHYSPNYYAAFVFDPDGNNVEAVTYL